MQNSVISKASAGVIAVLTWLALIIQFWLILNNISGAEESILAIVRYFSFFTILTNIIVAISSTCIVLSPKSYLAKPVVIAAITTYIIIVAVIYNIILYKLWQPKGWQLFADAILHSLTPVLYFLFWLLFVPKQQLRWKHSLSWLIYPFVYFIYILLRGGILNDYPYPFIDLRILSYGQVLLNCLMLMIAFIIAGIIIIASGKLIEKIPSPISSNISTVEKVNLLNRSQNVEVSDTTKDDSSNSA